VIDEERFFYTIALVGVVVVMAIAMRGRLRAAASKETLDRRQEGLTIFLAVRLAGLALWAGVITYFIHPASMAWSSVAFPSAFRWLGIGVLGGAVWLLGATLEAIGTNLTDTVVTRQAHTLVTRGPYRVVRHPFYGAMILLMTALTLLTSNWFFVGIGALVFVLLAVRSATEERKLLERFGEPYRLYRERTGRFLPRWHQ
jgi:protein-S-isoprenylcysteine O-methyltransferase Ste14